MKNQISSKTLQNGSKSTQTEAINEHKMIHLFDVPVHAKDYYLFVRHTLLKPRRRSYAFSRVLHMDVHHGARDNGLSWQMHALLYVYKHSFHIRRFVAAIVGHILNSR